nr:MAG TPA: endonuclease-like protein [Caudoviricetes sp.]
MDYLPAKKISDFLDNLGINYIKNDRTIISPLEIDIFIPDKKIGIEVNGNFWHSEFGGKDKNYHINKSKLCEEKGIKLIHIFEDEIENEFNIVKSRLSSILGKTENIIYARKCDIREVSSKEKREFINKCHIQGDSDRYELIRFCNKLKTTVVGGFSRLLKYFINEYKPKSLKTYCDIRWSGLNYEETVYYKNSFKFDGYSKPNYWYMQKNNLLKRYHRYNFTKHSILSKHNELNKNKTEWQLMCELGYNRIYDCGNMKFSLEIN